MTDISYISKILIVFSSYIYAINKLIIVLAIENIHTYALYRYKCYMHIMASVYIFILKHFFKVKKIMIVIIFKIYLNKMLSTKNDVLCLYNDFFTHKRDVFRYYTFQQAMCKYSKRDVRWDICLKIFPFKWTFLEFFTKFTEFQLSSSEGKYCQSQLRL